MADTRAERPKDPKKVFLGGLNDTVTADLLRQVVEPAAKGDQIVSINVVPETHPDFAGKKMAFIECKDMATVAAIIDLLRGEKMSELAEGELEPSVAFAPRPPRLTKVDVDAIVAALNDNPRFAERCRGKDGKAPTKDEVVAALKADPMTKGAPGKDAKAADVAALLKADPTIKGADGKAPTKDEVAAMLKPVVTADLKADDVFVVSVTGPQGLPGKDASKVTWILCLVLATLAFLIVLGHAFCGSQSTQGEWGIHGQVGPRGPQGLEGPAGPKGDPAPVTAVKEAAIAKPEEPAAPEPTAVAPAPEPTVPHAVGAIVVRDRFDRVEVRLDRVEQKLHEHFCAGNGSGDQERCAATH